MRKKTYRVISLQVFLHCTLGGFADTEPEDAIEARMYRAGRPVEEITAIADISLDTLYRRLRASGVNFRHPVNRDRKSPEIKAA